MRKHALVRRAVAALCAALVCALLIPAALGEETAAGCWMCPEGGEAPLMALHEDGAFERYDWDGRLLDAGLYQIDGETLLFYTGATRYVQRFAEREGWMDLTDGQNRTTAWFNATPEDVENEGLAPDPERPEVGVWSEMAGDTAIRLMELYDDGVFAFSEPTGTGDDLLGRYELKNGLLSLYPDETAYTLSISECGIDGKAHGYTYEPGDMILIVIPEEGAPRSYVRVDRLLFAPTAEELRATDWASADGSVAYAFGDEEVVMSGQTLRYELRGGLLYLRCDDPAYSAVVALRLTDDRLTVTGEDVYGKQMETVLERK